MLIGDHYTDFDVCCSFRLQSTVRVALMFSLLVVMASVSTVKTMTMVCVTGKLTVQMDPMNVNVAN